MRHQRKGEEQRPPPHPSKDLPRVLSGTAQTWAVQDKVTLSRTGGPDNFVTVSSICCSAAACGPEFTLPGVSSPQVWEAVAPPRGFARVLRLSRRNAALRPRSYATRQRAHAVAPQPRLRSRLRVVAQAAPLKPSQRSSRRHARATTMQRHSRPASLPDSQEPRARPQAPVGRPGGG